MIVNGKLIAQEIKESLKEETDGRDVAPTLFVIVIGGDAVTDNFIKQKKKFAEYVGINFHVENFSTTVSQEDIISFIKQCNEKPNSGVVVQLPLPNILDKDVILNTVTSTHDIDLLSSEALEFFKEGSSDILPPVVGAIKEILIRAGVTIREKGVVVIGHGRLVGVPAAIWFEQEGAHVTIVDIDTPDISELTKEADIIVSGAGDAGLIKPEMLKQGVILLDAGTSEAEGNTAGDADPECLNKCSLFTPVPGGIGPIAVAMLFKNLITLTK
jgi:methylenetetrahydrofolate dehydrogenase (NADP+) / methenyltetrahydrofolate cyclohydrolase